MNTRIDLHQMPKGLLEGLIKTELYLKKSGLDLKLIELVKYRVSQINKCGYCLDMHHQEALALGESELRLHTLIAYKECPYFEDHEKLALEFAENLTLTSETEVDDQLYARLKKYYPEEQIFMLTLVITQINAWNRINKTVGAVPGSYTGTFE
ncbi:carboxymuconolactone decarboxylase family protein [Chryseobacterium sp. G0240]|uniref:carboxymuconolactone decarboxylase family protein n=1 Tax=Chryseobacterium sp. G0240 TaxID=2487066 RepID=UPI000F447FE4|nr:carboxymuconolactone decarboxylase family protein [Chryseobacterium sp. G0240]ROI06734.1 carboxymuconolactone decarboxylase family protein [Chryseobacterium sp. G0240]